MMEYFGWSSGAFLLTACVAQPIFGRFYVSGHQKVPLICGVLLYHSGTTLCALTNSRFAFVLGRALSGVGAASLYMGGQAVVVSLVSVKDVALCLSIFSFVSLMFGMMLPVLSGIIIDLYSWRLIFFLSLPFSLGGLALLLHAYRSEKIDQSNAKWWKQVNKVDIAGTASLILAFLFLLAPLNSDSVAWDAGRLLGFCGFFIIFGYLQYSNALIATIAPGVFAKRQVWICSIIACSLEIAIFTYVSCLKFASHTKCLLHMI